MNIIYGTQCCTMFNFLYVLIDDITYDTCTRLFDYKGEFINYIYHIFPLLCIT